MMNKLPKKIKEGQILKFVGNALLPQVLIFLSHFRSSWTFSPLIQNRISLPQLSNATFFPLAVHAGQPTQRARKSPHCCQDISQPHLWLLTLGPSPAPVSDPRQEKGGRLEKDMCSFQQQGSGPGRSSSELQPRHRAQQQICSMLVSVFILENKNVFWKKVGSESKR